MANDDGAFYLLGDDEMGKLATAAPRFTPGKGKADIGGRMRIAQIMRDAGLHSPIHPVRVAGSTNEVWQVGDYIIRVGLVPGAHRLRREARLAQILPSEVQYPPVIASGIESFGEWIIVRHRPGVQLSEAWSYMSKEQRRAAVHDLARTMRAVHSMKLDDSQLRDLAVKDEDGPLALPHQLPASRILETLDRAANVPYMDAGLIRDAIERTESLSDTLWVHERHGLVHGDLHFENVMTLDNYIVGILDFEWSRPAPREIDLDILSRFCASPELHVGGNYPIDKKDYVDVLFWWAEAYPEIFEAEDLKDRLMLCALAFEVPWLLKFPPTGPLNTLHEFHPARQLRELLDKGTHTERLGFTGERDRYADFY